MGSCNRLRFPYEKKRRRVAHECQASHNSYTVRQVPCVRTCTWICDTGHTLGGRVRHLGQINVGHRYTPLLLLRLIVFSTERGVPGSEEKVEAAPGISTSSERSS